MYRGFKYSDEEIINECTKYMRGTPEQSQMVGKLISFYDRIYTNDSVVPAYRENKHGDYVTYRENWIISDKTYDTIRQMYTDTITRNVELEVMPSLIKPVKNTIECFKKLMKGYSRIVVSEKLDGTSIYIKFTDMSSVDAMRDSMVCYSTGYFNNISGNYLRMTKKVSKYFEAFGVFKRLWNEFKDNDKLIIRGEVLCRNENMNEIFQYIRGDDFNKKYKEWLNKEGLFTDRLRFKYTPKKSIDLPRNEILDVINDDYPDGAVLLERGFIRAVLYEVIYPIMPISEQFETFKRIGVSHAKFEIFDIENVPNTIEWWNEILRRYVDNSEYVLDGIVISVDTKRPERYYGNEYYITPIKDLAFKDYDNLHNGYPMRVWPDYVIRASTTRARKTPHISKSNNQ